MKSKTEIFIEKSRKVHGDLYDYSKVNYINNSTKVIIIDPEYGEFLQRPEVHLLGKGNINRNIKHTFEVDHILPFSLLCKTVDRCYYLNTKIGKLFNSSFNKKILSVSENKTKSDNIILFGKIIKGRNYRGDYELIRYLFKRNYYIDINLYI